jgi:protoheme IX farnesyltransferase
MLTNAVTRNNLKAAIWTTRTMAELLKLRVAALLTFVAITTAFVAANGAPALNTLIWLTVAGLLSAGGSATLNHYFDRDIDAIMPRTRNRPIPSGRVAPGVALALGLSLTFLSLPVALMVNPLLALFVALGAIFYIPIYTLILKRRTWLNIVVGGAAGSFASLAGWAAIQGQVTSVAWLIAALLFFWTPPHFWAFALVHADAYRKANVPMLPVIVGEAPTIRWIFWHALLLVALSVGLGWVAGLGFIYWLAALVGDGALLKAAWRLRRTPSMQHAWQMYKTSSMYLAYLCLGMLVDSII